MTFNTEEMGSNDQQRSFPLILPNGVEVDLEIFKSCDYKISEYMKRYEFFTADSSKMCLNKPNEMDNEPLLAEIRTPNAKLDPEKAVRLILSELIKEIMRNSAQHIFASDMIRLRQSKNICEILKKTVVLNCVHLNELETIEKTTCFLINLTNLMFLHALIFNQNESVENLTPTNWVSRHTYFNSIGYFVGQLGFVSLYDLYSYLFKFPTTSLSSELSSLKYSADSRVPFAIGQPYALSPKIHIAYPDTLDEYLKFSQTEYLNVISVFNTDHTLIISIPLLLQVERAGFDDKLAPYSFQNAPLIREKINSLLQLVGNGSLQCSDAIKNGILLVNEPQFTVHFSYSDRQMACDVQSFHKILWKFCCHHVSFFHCCLDFMLAIKSDMVENRCKDSPDSSIDEIDNEINVMDIYENIVLFAAVFAKKFKYDAETCPENMRCLFNILSFLAGESVDSVSHENTEFKNIFQVLRQVSKFNSPVSETFAKIRACEKVLMLDQKIQSKWLDWYNLFIEEPSVVLSLILDLKDSKLAAEFVDAQSVYNPFYEFNKEMYASFLSLICHDDDCASLKNYIDKIDECRLIEMVDFLIESECPVAQLNVLVSGILRHLQLSDVGYAKFYTLWMSLLMLSAAAEKEQVLFYEILHYPHLIVEQLVMNKCSNILKRALNISRVPVVAHRVVAELETEFRSKVDQILIEYAEKALYFTKDPFLEVPSKTKKEEFIPPNKIPTVYQWVPDEKVSECVLCQRRFTVFTRRHHCRRCGRVSCHFCSAEKLKFHNFDVPVRVCDDCYEHEKPFEIVNCNVGNPQGSSSKSKIFWQLGIDEKSNRNLREKATFKDGPDIAFCMALIELHTPNAVVARFVCNKAEEMTKILRHRLIFIANFDYNIVATCARALAYAAKLLFSQLNDVRGIRRCEEMANETELLKICAHIEYRPVDPNSPMRNVEQWNTIKERLTNLGEYQKALEIASKIGADTKSIWFLWGLSLIKSGDWISAREKLKLSSIGKKSSAIKEILETIDLSSTGPKFDEGLYYIQQYGNADMLYRYYVQFNKIESAVEMAFKELISPDLFVQTLFIPFVKNAQFTKILKCMKKLDPSRAQWLKHIRCICDYCDGEHLYAALYEVQIWMDDHYKASISCTKYYKRDSHCYNDLLEKSEWLSRAICHLNSFNSQSEEKRFTKCIKKSQIDRLLSILHWQIQVTATICSNKSVAEERFESLPTLLGTRREYSKVVGLIFAAMTDVEQAFTYTRGMVDQFSLDLNQCYGEAAFTLMKCERENDLEQFISLVERAANDTTSTIDYILVQVLRAKPQVPRRYFELINDSKTKIEVLIETNLLRDAFKAVIRYEEPAPYLQRLFEISIERNLTWLIDMVSQRSRRDGIVLKNPKRASNKKP